MTESTVALNYISRGVAKAQADLAKLQKEIRKTGSEARKSGRSGRAFSGSLRSVGAAALNINKPIISLGKNITQLGNHLNAVGERATRLGFRLSALVTLPIVAGFKGAISSAVDFETELVKIETLVGLTREETDKFGKALLDLAPTVGALPTDLVKSAFFVTSAGIRDTAVALDVVEHAAKASALGLGEVDKVAQALTTIMIAYKGTNIDAAEATDFLIGTTQRGAFELDKFADALGGSLGLSAELGIGLNEVSAGVATLTQTGLRPSEAFTALDRLFLSLSKVTPQMQEALERAGLSMEGLTEKITEDDGVIPALFEMREAFDKAGVSAAEFFTRKQGLDAFLRLTGEASDLLVDNLEVINNSAGLLEQGFERVSLTAGFQFDQLKSSLSQVAITIGALLLPAVTSIVQKLLPVLGVITELGKQHPKIVLVATAFLLMAAVMGPLLAIFGVMASSISAIISLIGVLITVVGVLLGPVTIVFTALGAMAAAIGALFLVSLPQILEKTGQTFEDLGQKAWGWGRNIIIQLARGIAAGIIAVVEALIQVGRVIRDWLVPGSPPKLLPDIDDWGASAMTEFLRGFSKADFGVFKELAGTVSSFFQSLPRGTFGEDNEGVFGAILGSRSAIAEAIAQIRATGRVTQEVMSRVSGSFGAVSDDIREYTLLLFDLEKAQFKVNDAQEKINRINENFLAITEPINKRLGEIARRRQEVRDKLRVDELERILEDPRAPALAKELAQLELEEIGLKRRLTAQEQLRDTELSAAEKELAAAEAELSRLQEAVDVQKELIDAQIENNRLMNQWADAIENAANKLKSLGASGGAEIGSVLGGLGTGSVFGDPNEDGPFSALQEGLDIFGDNIKEKVGEIGTELETLGEEILAFFEPLFGDEGLLAQLGDVWSDIFLNLGNLQGKLDEFKGDLADQIPPWEDLEEKIGSVAGYLLTIAGLMLEVKGLSLILGPVLSPLLTSILLTVGAAIENIVVALTGSALFAGGVVTGGLLLAIGALIAVVGVAIAKHGSFAGAVDEAKRNIELIGLIIGITVVKYWTKFYIWVEKNRKKIVEGLLKALYNLRNDLVQTREKIETQIIGALKAAREALIAAATDFYNAGVAWIDGIIGGIGSKVEHLASTVRGIAQSAKAAWDEFWQNRSPSKVAMEDAKNVMSGYLKGVEGGLPALSRAFAASGALGQAAFSTGQVSAPSIVNNQSVNMGPISINNGMDQALLEATIRRVMDSSL